MMAHKTSSALFLLLAILHISTPAVQGYWWRQIEGGLTWVTVTDWGDIWGVDAGQNVYRYEVVFSLPKWVRKPGKLVQISAGASGVWGVNAASEVFTWVPSISNWRKVAGLMTRVTSGRDVYGIYFGRVYAYMDNGQWQLIDGTLVDISMGDDGQLWGVNSQGQVYSRAGYNWVQMPGTLARVTVGRDGVYGVNAAYQVFRWNGADWVGFPGSLRQIDSGDVVMGVNSAGQIFQMK